MLPPHVGALIRVWQNMRSSARVIEMQDMPTVVDVDEIHTPEYELTTMHVEEEQITAQEVG